MPKPKKGPRFGGHPDHHKHIVGNLATELIRNGRIRTTKAKAKHVQPVAERMITFARRGDLHSRRQANRVIKDQDVVHKLFTDVGPAFAQRNGGYTRVLKLGPRKGDGAEMAMLELVEGVTPSGQGGELTEQPRRRWSLRRRKGAAADQQAPQPDASQAASSADDAFAPEADPEEIEARLGAEDEVEASWGSDAEQDESAGPDSSDSDEEGHDR